LKFLYYIKKSIIEKKELKLSDFFSYSLEKNIKYCTIKFNENKNLIEELSKENKYILNELKNIKKSNIEYETLKNFIFNNFYINKEKPLILSIQKKEIRELKYNDIIFFTKNEFILNKKQAIIIDRINYIKFKNLFINSLNETEKTLKNKQEYYTFFERNEFSVMFDEYIEYLRNIRRFNIKVIQHLYF